MRGILRADKLDVSQVLLSPTEKFKTHLHIVSSIKNFYISKAYTGATLGS